MKRRRRTGLIPPAMLAGLWLAAMGTPAAADAPAPGEAAPSQGVTPYPAAFFAPMGVNTAYDMILRLPGFTLDDGSAVRGFAGSAGNVLIDGLRPPSKTDDLIGVLQRLPAAQVERIDLIRGGAPGIDMQGKTVVANIVRKTAKGFTGAAQYGHYMPEAIPVDPQVRLEGSWRDGDHLLEVSLFAARFHDLTQTPGPHDIYGPGGTLIDQSHMENDAPNYQYTGVLTYAAPLLGGKLETKLTLADAPYDLVNLDNFQVAGQQIYRSDQDFTDGELGLHYTRDFGRALSLELVGLQHVNRTSYRSTFDTESDDQLFDLRESEGESIGRAVLHWRPTRVLSIDGGGEFAYNWLRTHTLFTDNGAVVPLPAANVLVQESRGEVFTTLTWRASPRLTVEGGVRVEASTLTSSGDLSLIKTLVYPKPRLVATYTLDPADQFRLRVEREVGQLNFAYFAATATLNGPGVFPGDPSLLPQTDWAFEAAYDRRFWKDGVLSLTLRRLLLEDVIDQIPAFTPQGVFSEPGNIGGGTETDVVASFNLPLARLGIARGELRGLGTWRIAEVVDPTTGQTRPISGQHPVDAELHFTQDLPRWKLNWGLDSVFAYRWKTYYFNEVDAFHNGNSDGVFVEYRMRPDLAIRLEAHNFNRASYYATRQVYTGARNQDPLDFVDTQERRAGIYSFLRIRKTFK